MKHIACQNICNIYSMTFSYRFGHRSERYVHIDPRKRRAGRYESRIITRSIWKRSCFILFIILIQVIDLKYGQADMANQIGWIWHYARIRLITNLDSRLTNRGVGYCLVDEVTTNLDALVTATKGWAYKYMEERETKGPDPNSKQLIQIYVYCTELPWHFFITPWNNITTQTIHHFPQYRRQNMIYLERERETRVVSGYISFQVVQGKPM